MSDIKMINTGVLLDEVSIDSTKIAAFNPKDDEITDVNIMLKVPEKQIILDQGNTGSCVAHSLVMCESIILYNRTNKWVDFDPFVIYGTVNDGDHDGYGMYPCTAIRNCINEGFYFKRDFGEKGERPYITNKVREFKNNNPDLVTQAKKYTLTGRATVYNATDVKKSLSLGMPVSATWDLYSSFLNVKANGIVYVPNTRMERCIGRHQMTIIGIKDDKYYIVVNSYGEQYGFKGIYFIPFNYYFTQAFAISDTIIPTTYKAKEIIMKINDPNISIDGSITESDLSPTIINDRTMIPIRIISEALGASVEWIQESESIIIRSEEALIKLKIGDSRYYIDNNAYEMDTAPIIVNERTLVPVRFISEAMNCTVDWDQSEQKVTIKCL